MTPFSAPLSAVRQSQWEAQLDMFRRLSSSALDSTERLVALNMRTSRASLEQAAGTVRQMLEASDPRDLLAVGSVAQGQWHQMFAYGRELLGIASGLRTTWSTLPSALPVPTAPLRLISPAPSAEVPGTPDQAAEQVADQAAIATAEVVTITSENGAAAADIGSAFTEAVVDAAPMAEAATPAPEAAIEPAPIEPLQAVAPAAAQSTETPSPLEAAFGQAIESALADGVPPVEHTPIAQALAELAPTSLSALHPIASTVPLDAGDKIELPVVNPVEHTPPPVAPTRAPRTSRKK